MGRWRTEESNERGGDEAKSRGRREGLESRGEGTLHPVELTGLRER